MKRVSPLLIPLVTLAFIIGAAVDRAIVSGKNASAPAKRPMNVASQSGPQPNAAQVLAAAPSSRSAATGGAAKKSLDAILSERDRRQRTTDLENYINNLQLADYGAALKRIRRMPGNNDRELASRLLVARWVQADPDSALQFAASNRGYEYIADDVFEQAAAADFQTALERAKSMPSGDLRYMALRGVLSFMADTNPTGALQLAQTLGDFPGNEPLSSVVFRQWAAVDPQRAALAAAQQNIDGWRSPVNQVVRTWAGQDPAAAANWSLSLSDAGAQSRSLSQIMRQWARENPTAAANWINALPQGSSYDAAVAAFAQSLVQSDPQYAINWAQNIADETARNNALRRVSREVMWRHPTDGAAILQAAGIPANLIPPSRERGRRGP